MYNETMNKGLCILGTVLLACFTRADAADQWAIHEWGTFTSLQDENGQTIGGINTDDEPVPAFVHRLGGFALLSPSEVPPSFNKGAPSCHPDVTMRLETPVIYFHPPESGTKIKTISVAVNFRGGWLTEFYPRADADAPGLKNCTNGFPRLFSSSGSRLEWNDLQIGGDWPVTDTSAHVWTSPRAVQSALVQTADGESENFLFYRGVAHIDAPLKISRDEKSGELLFQSQLEGFRSDQPLDVHSIWLVDIQPGGKIAFRSLPSLSLDRNSEKYLARTQATFAHGDYSAGNLEKLKTGLLSALVLEGLDRDEAQALLNTWEVSYFKSPGLRVFFLVPRAWTDFYLPLEVSQPADIRRVMVGRIELVTPRQRQDLLTLSRFSANQIQQEYTRFYSSYVGPLLSASTNHASEERMRQVNLEMAQVSEGKRSLASFVSIPKTYQTYLDLGRFRNALILDEARARSTPGLTDFIATYRLQGYRPAETLTQFTGSTVGVAFP
jgi:hypothetical protein